MHPRSSLARTLAGRLGLAALLGLGLVAALAWGGAIRLPGWLDPFAPLDIAEEPNWLTRTKLARLKGDGPLCLAVLRRAGGLEVTPVPDRSTGEGCGFTDAVEIDRSRVALSPADPQLTCPLAAAWALFERHVLDEAARAHLGVPVKAVEHVGTYACRNLYHRASGRRSEHATANAIDVAGFTLADGTRVRLDADWSGPDPRRAAFLRAVRDGACRYFNVVLGPDYNEAHRDHFHFDMGPFRTCR